jgi:GalNAc-alpha-(1->4)-GalNAc-alpha-(1->3)-diNAcBac-PP-undecaprenol alpha-1,4-N-acetyl-D-galactosaminyltransferase
MKILFVIPTLGQGGAQRVLVNLANALSQSGAHEVAIATFASDVKAPHHQPDAGVTVYYLNGISGTSAPLIGLIRCFKGLRKLVRQLNPEVVVAFQDIANFPTILACAGTGARLTVSERQDTRYYRFAAVRVFLRRCFYRYADTVVVQTELVRRQMPDGILHKTVVIPNPIPNYSLQASSGESQDGSFQALSVGRLAPQKNLPLLIDAAAIVLKRRLDWSLTIFGEGTLRDVLQQQINDHAMEDRIFLAGVTDDVYARMADAHLFVLPSKYEGFPNVLAEAATIGLPCIAYDDVSGVPELIEHDRSGVLLTANQRTDVDLANAMALLMDSAVLRNSMGQAARQRVQRFSRNVVLSNWTNVLGLLELKY